MTAYQTVPIKLAVGENKSRSRSWSSSSCVNMYVDTQMTGRNESALLPWPGEKLFSSGQGGTINRGMHVVDGVPYTVLDQTLYKINADGTQSNLGTVPGRSRISFADDGFNLIMRVDGTATFINGKFILQGNGATYMYNGSSIETINFTAFTNNDEFIVSLTDNPRNYPSSNIGNAILDGDELKQVYVFQRKIIMGGASSIEFFFDAGEGSPPIQVVSQASTTEIGVASSYSMAETPNYLYFLGADNLVYKIINFDIQSVTPSAIARELREADTSDAAGFTVQIDGQWFYILHLSNSDFTLAYSEATNTWIRLSSGTNLGKHLLTSVVYAYGKNLISDATSSNVYEWDFGTYNSNGSTIVRQFDTANINGLQIGAPGKRLITNQIRFIMESGVGNSGKENPKMMVQSSQDGGRTFGKEFWLDMKRAGESTALVDWHNCFTFYDLVLRVRVSDPVFAGFHAATIDVKGAGY